MRTTIYVAILVLLFIGCSKFSDSDLGKKGEPCFGNETCRGDLVCQEGVCVDPDESKADEDSVNDNDSANDSDNGNTGNTGADLDSINDTDNGDTGNTGTDADTGNTGNTGDDDVVAVDADDTLDEDMFDQDSTDDDADIYTGPDDVGEMVLIPAGSFWMGSPDTELGRTAARETLHYVQLTKSFYIGKYEVTQGEFNTVMGYNPSNFQNCGNNCPVEKVNWHEALKYANELSKFEGLPECFDCTGTAPDFTCSLKSEYSKPQDCLGYRLPTESEWEYAARAATDTAFYNGDATQTAKTPLDPNLDAIGWYGGNSSVIYTGGYDCSGWFTGATTCGTQSVGGKLPNAFGLYDTSGNVYEWTYDWYQEAPSAGDETTPIVDPYGPGSGSDRVVRGGSWYHESQYCRSAYRGINAPNNRYFRNGFRIVRTAPIPDMVLIPAGSFWMGSPDTELGRSSTETLHYVELTKSFYMGKYEVTQSEFNTIMGYNPSYFPNCGNNCPVEMVSWHEALKYANELSKLEALPECFDCLGTSPDFTCSLKSEYSKPQDCLGYRPPTDSEWEYAARAGTTTAFYNGEITKIDNTPLDPNLDAIGWYGGNSSVSYTGGDDCSTWFTGATTCGTNPIGGKLSNAFGLYDMSGNVREWTYDWYNETYPAGDETTPVVDPYGPESASFRAVRGGSWVNYSQYNRSASRANLTPTYRRSNVGFRLARTAPGTLCTGQSKCYNETTEMVCPSSSEGFYGQDDQYADMGYCNSRSYTITGTNPEEIVIDNNTGLQWQRSIPATYSGCTGGDPVGSLCTWQEAVDYCNGLNYGGKNDWRVPEMKEILYLSNFGNQFNALELDVFENVPSDMIWSSNLSIDGSNSAWYYYANYGSTSYHGKNNTHYVICVSGTSSKNDSSFFETKIYGESVVIDTYTGIVWAQASTGNKTWKEALEYCEKLNYAGSNTWRLPNINELETIIDLSKFNPASNFPSIVSVSLWSSTTRAISSNGIGWSIDTNTGIIKGISKTDQISAICIK